MRCSRCSSAAASVCLRAAAGAARSLQQHQAGRRQRDCDNMGNAASSAKGSDSRPFSPDFGSRDLSATPVPEVLLPLPKNRLLLSQHSTEERDAEDERTSDSDGQVGDLR